MVKYAPGVCNIGTENIERRKKIGLLMLALTIILFLIFKHFIVPKIYLIFLAIPLMSGYVSLFQAREKFCIAHGLKNTSDMT